MKERTIKALINAFDKTDELFFISKQGDKFELIHSEITDAEEFLDMVYHFADILKQKVSKLKQNDIDNDALDDLLDDLDINLS